MSVEAGSQQKRVGEVSALPTQPLTNLAVFVRLRRRSDSGVRGEVPNRRSLLFGLYHGRHYLSTTISTDSKLKH